MRVSRMVGMEGVVMDVVGSRRHAGHLSHDEAGQLWHHGLPEVGR